MKALILAAGHGTRLLPFTRILPKPLFTLNNRSMLDIAVERLIGCGCTKIYINTHHLAHHIHEAVRHHPDAPLLETVHEPTILDTGGAVANLKKKLMGHDFLVINADIVCDFDLNTLMETHRTSGALATLLVHDCLRFNKLGIAHDGKKTFRITDFEAPPETGLAFTGIQALSPKIFEHMPEAGAFSSIEIYKALCRTGRIQALKAKHLYWQDVGTPEDYVNTARQHLSGCIFGLPPSRFHDIDISPLDGDGSDRKWFRACCGDKSIVISDHGICLDIPHSDTAPRTSSLSTQPDNLAQLKAFTAIGSHLTEKGICVPKVLGHDTISGQVALEDLGTTHLADLVHRYGPEQSRHYYCKAIDALVDFSQRGIRDFDPDWTCQTAAYSKDLILNMECRYFLNAFVKGYLKKNAQWQAFDQAFEYIADQALAHGYQGLMHRDLQSRNIMVYNEKIRFIDFQSARKGPIQYDLASLLIDPYVKLPQAIQDDLLAFAVKRLGVTGQGEKKNFIHSYEYCCITRNLQMLGAFAFLTREKQKKQFGAYIPLALARLKERLTKMNNNTLAPFVEFANRL